MLMILFRATSALAILLIAALLAAGCTGHDVKPLTSKALFEVPIGGFESTVAVLEPNSTFETNYVLYTRNWGPGEVNYTLSAWYINGSYLNRTYWCCPFLLTDADVHIEPSSFYAEPNHTYRSKVTIGTRSFPREFFTGGGGVYHPVRLNISVRLENNTSDYTDDSMGFKSISLGPLTWDTIISENCSIRIKPGETKTFSFTFLHDYQQGIKVLSYTTSGTPLNVTVTPSTFIAKWPYEFPFTISIKADRSLPPGNYPFNIAINGATSQDLISCLDNGTYLSPQNKISQSFLPVDVTVG